MADIYTVETLARDAGVPKKAVVKAIKKGKLPAANIGSWLFPHYVMSKADVFEFLKRCASKYTRRAKEKHVSHSRESHALQVD